MGSYGFLWVLMGFSFWAKKFAFLHPREKYVWCSKRFEKVRKNGKKRGWGMRGARRGHRITIMNQCRQRQPTKFTTKFGAAAPLGSARRNTVTRPGNIDDYRCPRRNIAP